MRLISPGANPPADVDKYLLPHEQEVITVRKHPAVLLAPLAWAVLGLIVAAVFVGKQQLASLKVQLFGVGDEVYVVERLILAC